MNSHKENPDDNSRPGEPHSLRIAAVGDLLMTAGNGENTLVRDPADVFAGVSEIFSECDVVFGNLECTLGGAGETVDTEPRVISTIELIRSIGPAGFNVVTLANNHTFDCLQAGFHNVRRLLDEMGVAHFGAGDDLDEASAPAMLECNGVRLGFLGAVDERSGPAQFAGQNRWGVAPLDADRLVEQIHNLGGEVDHVIISVHWGEERFGVPSPVQIGQARAFVEAGASMVIGHHPHVIQGLEVHRNSPTIYSLGNFVADDVYYSDGDAIRWNRTERTGCILLAELDRTGVMNVRQVPTYDTGRSVEIDRSGFGDRRIARVNRTLAGGVSLRRYRREHLWVKTIKPALGYLRWSKLKTLRLGQIRNAIKSIFRAGKAK